MIVKVMMVKSDIDGDDGRVTVKVMILGDDSECEE